MLAKLTTQTVANALPKEKPYEIGDTDLKGFLLRVEVTGSKTYYARYRTKTGRQMRFRIGPSPALKLAQARERTKEILAEAALGNDPAAERRAGRAETLGAFIEGDYLTWAKAHLRTGEASADRIKSCFGSLWSQKPADITQWHVEKWRSERLNKSVARSTINRDVAALRSALSKALEWGNIQQHPLLKLKPLASDRSAKVRYLSAEEERALLVALDEREEAKRLARKRYNEWRLERRARELLYLPAEEYADYLKPMVIISLNTGLRRGELFQLQWADVDLAAKRLTVAGKTAKNSNTRHIPLNADALAALVKWRDQTQDDGLVFVSPKTGGPFDNVNTAWREVLEVAKLKAPKQKATKKSLPEPPKAKTVKGSQVQGFRWHDMRHTFASRLVQSGVDLNTVRELLGHGDIKMTLRYAHLAPETKATAVERIAGWSERTAPASNVVAFTGRQEP